MTDSDPSAAAARKAAVLEQDRARQKAVRAASQPFFIIGIACLVLAIGLGLWGMASHNAGDMVLPVPFLICIGALSHAVAGIRASRWIRQNPLPPLD